MPSKFDSYFAALKGKRVAVLGLGVSNRPLVRLLLEYGCHVIGCDRTIRENLDDEVLELEKAGCILQVGESYLDHIEADVAFRTPGMHPDTPALVRLRQKGTAVTSEMDVFFHLCPCPIIAVTGSDGKTTTTTLIAEMLKAAGRKVWLGGNIGTPLLPICRQIREEDIAVAELSSFQLMDMTHSPNVAVITNLAPNHLDVHKDMEEYVQAKFNIFRFQKPDGVLIVNADNEITSGLKNVGKTLRFSRKTHVTDGVHYENGAIYRNGNVLLRRSEILLPGDHNVENYMAAVLAVSDFVGEDAIRKVASSFGGVEHRLELVKVKDGVRFYNDSIASSPTRTMAALKCFPEKILLIAGGYDKQIPYDVLGEPICVSVKKLYVNGATGGKIRDAVTSCPIYSQGHPEIWECNDLEEAIRLAAEQAVSGDSVVLSPASAAFDQFKNFAVRGAFFRKIVEEL